MSVRRLLPLVLGLLLVAALVPARAQRITSKFEVRTLEIGKVIGRGGLSVRTYLVTNQAIDFNLDADEGRDFLALVGPFLEGRSRLIAELDGNRVVAVQVLGPSGTR